MHIFHKNIQHYFFSEHSEESFQKIIDQLFLPYNGKKHIWFNNVNYINSCLELFFIYYNKFKDPYLSFLSLFLKLPEEITSNFNKLTYKKLNLFHLNEILPNDLGVQISDIILINSIKTYNCGFLVESTSKLKVYSGLSLESENGLSFVFKGNIDKSSIKKYVYPVLDLMQDASYNILDEEIHKLYLSKISYIQKSYDTFKIKQ